MTTVLLQDLQAVLSPLAAGGSHSLINEAQPPVLPYIVFTRIVSNANNSLDGASDLQNTRVQIDIYANTLAQAEAVNRLLPAAMATGPWDSAVDLSAQDFYEPDTRLNRISRDWSIWARN